MLKIKHDQSAQRYGNFLDEVAHVQNYVDGLGGSPGLVVMGRDSCSEGCGFKSRHRLLDGHFFTLICCKKLYSLKRSKINEKRPGMSRSSKNVTTTTMLLNHQKLFVAAVNVYRPLFHLFLVFFKQTVKF